MLSVYPKFSLKLSRPFEPNVPGCTVGVAFHKIAILLQLPLTCTEKSSVAQFSSLNLFPYAMCLQQTLGNRGPDLTFVDDVNSTRSSPKLSISRVLS